MLIFMFVYVYLYQNTERLQENIKKRGRDYEQNIEIQSLIKMMSLNPILKFHRSSAKNQTQHRGHDWQKSGVEKRE